MGTSKDQEPGRGHDGVQDGHFTPIFETLPGTPDLRPDATGLATHKGGSKGIKLVPVTFPRSISRPWQDIGTLITIYKIYKHEKPDLIHHVALKPIIFGSIIGAWSHVFFDSFMHRDITPFWPSLENPFFGVISNDVNYNITIIAFVLGVGVYFYKLYKMRQK